MSHRFRSRAPLALLVCLASACGGAATPAPSSAGDAAGRERAEREKAQAERAKTSRLARLQTDEPAERAPESVVQVTLEPLVTGVRPGRKFVLAVHFRIAPGYRISWTNPGDVGKETVVAIQAPAGFQVGTPRFPVPERYTVAGGYGGFGYQGETAVFVEIKPPATLPPGRVHRFDLSASWVACKKDCATEHTEAFIELATTHGSAAAREVEATLLPFKERLPTPLEDVRDAEQEWVHEGRRSTLVAKIPGADLREFWPAGKAEPAPKKIAASGPEIRFVFDEKPGPDAKPVRGLVLGSAEGKDAFFELEAPSPDAREQKPRRTPKKTARPRRRR